MKPNQPDNFNPTVLFVCDSGPQLGVGHVMRCVALAQEIISSGAAVTFLANLTGLNWVTEILQQIGCDLITGVAADPTDVNQAIENLQPEVIVIDSYHLNVQAYAKFGALTSVLVAIVDGDPSGREAQLYVDQNPGSELATWSIPANSVRLAGGNYAMIRDNVRNLRPAKPQTGLTKPTQVLIVLGGTDAAGMAPTLASCTIATGAAVAIQVVAANPTTAAALAELQLGPNQTLNIVPAGAAYAELAADADLVLSAGGSSLWELCCLGKAIGVVGVAENQRESIEYVTAKQLASLVGWATDFDEIAATSRISALLDDVKLLEVLRSNAYAAIDGQGRDRVWSTTLAMLANRLH